MRYLATLLLAIVVSSCGANRHTSVLEVTTYKLKTTANALTFNKLDAEVENNFTTKQPGFIKRQSAVNENGEYTVFVYWNTMEDAKASMDKFMTDASVSDFASKIEESSMQMNRYTINEKFTASNSNFIEVMSFDTKKGTDLKKFRKINKKVEKGFTAKQPGFLQRITGVNEEEKQVVVVYWDNKTNSDAALQPFMNAPISKEFMGMMNQSSIQMQRSQTLKSLNNNMKLSNKNKVVALLNSFNTGDQTPISYINPEKYIQHNLAVADGLAGFGEVMHHAPEGGFKANVVRAFEDGNYVFTHTEYDFFGPKAGFDVFRFENGQIVEHWDNLIAIQPKNQSGRTQFDGATELKDLEKTESNRTVVQNFIDDILFAHKTNFTDYINPAKYIQHNPAIADGLEGFGAAMKYFAQNGLVMEFEKTHHVLAEGNFVLSMSEGKFGKGEHTAFYDLFRLEDGKIVEHWDVIAPIEPKSQWKNTNGKF